MLQFFSFHATCLVVVAVHNDNHPIMEKPYHPDHNILCGVIAYGVVRMVCHVALNVCERGRERDREGGGGNKNE